MGFISLPQDQHEEEYVSKKHSIFFINKSSVAISVFMYRKATVKVKYQQDNLFWFSILANSTPQSHYLVCWEATLYLLRAGLALSLSVFIFSAELYIYNQCSQGLSIWVKTKSLPLSSAWRIATSTSPWLSSLALKTVSKWDILMMSWIWHRKQTKSSRTWSLICIALFKTWVTKWFTETIHKDKKYNRTTWYSSNSELICLKKGLKSWDKSSKAKFIKGSVASGY